MKLRTKDPVEGRFMKKLLLTCILIMSIIFIAGCIGDEKTDAGTPASHQINQESDGQTTDSILKPSDIPGLTLDRHEFWAVPKNMLYVCNETGRTSYTNTLPMGYRNVGEDSQWRDQSGREVRIILNKYDSAPNHAIESLTNTTARDNYGEVIAEHFPDGFDYDWGDPHIGDCSWYLASTDQSTDIQTTGIWLVYNNNYVTMSVIDEKGKSKKEAIRIAKVIKSRLD